MEIQLIIHRGYGIKVEIDIKPQSCPNPLKVKSKGVLPVAILGTEYFNVAEVDLITVMLEGISPLRWAIEDVATPSGSIVNVNEPDCSLCSDEGPDGYLDLVLKFDTQEILATFDENELNNGNCLVLTLTGELLSHSTFIMGRDVVLILNKGK